MTRNRLALQAALAAAVTAVALTACGSSAGYYNVTSAAPAANESISDTAAYDGGIYETAAAAEEYDMAEYAEEGIEIQEGTGASEEALAGRKLIKNVNLNVETEQFDTLLSGLESRVTALGGYIEEMSSYSRNDTYAVDYSGTRYLRYANMTVRMPKEKLDMFLAEVGEQSNVVSRSESVTDVTLQYVDLESHKKALATEQDRLLVLMEQAESVEDIIAIEGRLSEVRYQLESMESQLRTYDNQIDYSTIYLSIDEVKRYSPAENAGIAERIRRGFMNSLWGIGQEAVNCVIWVLINLPYLVLWAVVVVLVWLILRIIYKAVRKRRAKKGDVHDKRSHFFSSLLQMYRSKQDKREQGEPDRQAAGQPEATENENKDDMA